MGCYEISLGDTIGTGTPGEDADADRDRRRGAFRSTQLAGHFHDTYGQALGQCLRGAGERRRHVRQLGRGLGGCPYAKGATGNVASEDVALPARGTRHRDRRRHDTAAASPAGTFSDFLGRPPVSRVARALDAEAAAAGVSAREPRAARARSLRRASASARHRRRSSGLCVGCYRTLEEIAGWIDRRRHADRRAQLQRTRCTAPTSMTAAARAIVRLPNRRGRRRGGRALTGISTSSRRSAYLQCEQLPALERTIRVRYRPVLFGGCSSAHGHKGPAEIPRQATLHLPVRRLAGEAHWACRSSFRRCIRSIRCRCCASRSPADCEPGSGAAHLPLRLARRAARRPADRMGRS